MIEKNKITIITPSLNQGAFIEDCICSVLNQNYENFEHIIIDACSTDNTIEVLKKYPHLIWISEPDSGQSDALNKALKMARGNIIGWLNADDYYCKNIFRKISDVFDKNSNLKWIVGNLYNKYEILNSMEPLPFVTTNYHNLLASPGIMRTQATFFTKEFINSVGLFDVNLHMAMDYDLWLKMASLSNPYNMKDFLCVFRIHAEQKTTPKNIFKQYKELLYILYRERAYSSLIKRTYTLVRGLLKRIVKNMLIKFGFIDKIYENIPLSRKSN